MLRASNRIVEAEAALRAATRANPAFAEAWYNLADLLDDQGRSEAAMKCLRKALVVAPDYIDCDVQSCADAATNRRLCRSRRLLAAVFGWRSFIGMGGTGPTVTQILRDSSKFGGLYLRIRRLG
jgi:tetratricopeptide (TPR) repeat protein